MDDTGTTWANVVTLKSDWSAFVHYSLWEFETLTLISWINVTLKMPKHSANAHHWYKFCQI